MARTATVVIVLAVLLFVLGGCAINGEYGAKILRTKFLYLQSGAEVAEIWVEAPDESTLISGDVAQDVVYLEHGLGRTALPDSLLNTSPTGSGDRAPIAVYHLVYNEIEVDYYKRRFARGDSSGL